MRLTRGNESIRCETVCSKIVYSDIPGRCDHKGTWNGYSSASCRRDRCPAAETDAPSQLVARVTTSRHDGSFSITLRQKDWQVRRSLPLPGSTSRHFSDNGSRTHKRPCFQGLFATHSGESYWSGREDSNPPSPRLRRAKPPTLGPEQRRFFSNCWGNRAAPTSA